METKDSSNIWGIVCIISAILWLGLKLHSCLREDPKQEESSYTETNSSGIQSWIVGDWRLTTPYGDEIVHFRDDGTCRMVDNYGVHYGTFSMTSSTVYVKYNDDPSTSTIEVEGKSLYAGGGYYYRKQ